MSGERWGIQGIPAPLASTAQIDDVLKGSGWNDIGVSDIRYAAAKRHYEAVVRAPTAPSSTAIDLG
eukprot:7687449-Alexandrium_andersonii.AAC.1